MRCDRDDELYTSTNSSSRYQHDPEYGGKLSLSGWKEAKSGAMDEPRPLPRMPPDHPRVRELVGAESVNGCAPASPSRRICHVHPYVFRACPTRLYPVW